MLLHRYFGSYAFETLKNASLLAARISTFNDPFEFLYIATGKMTASKARKIAEYKFNNPDESPNFWLEARKRYPNAKNELELKKLVKKQIPQIVINLVNGFEKIKNTTLENRGWTADQNLRAICFCAAQEVKLLDEILIWSHYAKKHEGVRIGFEFPSEIINPFKIVKIAYQEKRVEIDLSQTIENEIAGKMLMQSLQTKSIAWEYEHEYRLFAAKDKCREQNITDLTKEYFLDFNKEWVKSVDFGVRCPHSEVERILKLVRSEYPQKVICKKAVFHKTEYALEYQQI